MDSPDLRDAPSDSQEHRFRESIKSFQRFICDHYRIDETIVLMNAYLSKGDGINQTELVEKRVLKIEKISMSMEDLMHALDAYHRSSDLK
jgi:hypothetical protein